jgi:hypothetical protein
LIQLRKIGLLQKEDIQRYDLLRTWCTQYGYFVEKRFRFLVEWDPTLLTQTDRYGSLPIHYVANFSSVESNQAIQLALEYGIRYYSRNKGLSLLFKKNNCGNTPFQAACEKYGYEKVIKVVEDTLLFVIRTHRSIL